MDDLARLLTERECGRLPLLFARYSDRFLLGSDTWIPERWVSYDQIMAEYRSWLKQLPPAQAQRIAYGNAERLFGPRPAP